MNQKDERDIIHEVSNELLNELLEPVVSYINSVEFKNVLKERLKNEGVEIGYKDMDDEKHFETSNGLLSIPKYDISNSETIDNIQEDIVVLVTE